MTWQTKDAQLCSASTHPMSRCHLRTSGMDCCLKVWGKPLPSPWEKFHAKLPLPFLKWWRNYANPTQFLEKTQCKHHFQPRWRVSGHLVAGKCRGYPRTLRENLRCLTLASRPVYPGRFQRFTNLGPSISHLAPRHTNEKRYVDLYVPPKKEGQLALLQMTSVSKWNTKYPSHLIALHDCNIIHWIVCWSGTWVDPKHAFLSPGEMCSLFTSWKLAW